jgi:hypothetical protein
MKNRGGLCCVVHSWGADHPNGPLGPSGLLGRVAVSSSALPVTSSTVLMLPILPMAIPFLLLRSSMVFTISPKFPRDFSG